MAQPPKATILDHFAGLDDPRVARTRHHKLVDILAIAICGGDVFARLDPVQLQDCFISWTQAIAELSPGEVVAIDGKPAPCSDTGSRPDEIAAILRNERTLKVDIQGKGLNAGWDEDYLLKVLLG